MKPNRCTIAFHCFHKESKPCVYFKAVTGLDGCQHKSIKYGCMSSVARVNVMTVKIEELMRDEQKTYNNNKPN